MGGTKRDFLAQQQAQHPECGCHILCPLHAAAPQMREALEMATQEVIDAGGNRAIDLDSQWLEGAQDALTAARGGEK